MSGSFSLTDTFDRILYSRLLEQDQCIVDEYASKLTTAEINSFMQRFVDHYVTEERNEIEVNEEIDSIVVLERNSSLSKTDLSKRNTQLLNEIDKWIPQTPNQAYLFAAVKKYIEQHGRHIIDIDCIRDIYADLDPNSIRRVSAELPLRLYTYRIADGKSMVRMGIALDHTVLPAFKHSKPGFGRNFRLDKRFISVQVSGKDLTAYVKSAGFWQPRNAKLHGFDGRTGIIWFDGAKVSDSWRFPNGFVVECGLQASVNAVYSTDAFAKMVRRSKLLLRLDELIRGVS